jgi:hypothetical protein
MSSPGHARNPSSAPPTSSSGGVSGSSNRPAAGASPSRGSPSPSPSPSREGRILETPNLRIFTFAELKAATRNFKSDTLLGEGGFGRVHKGWVNEKTMSPARSGAGMPVAVKKLNPESLQGVQEWQVTNDLFFFLVCVGFWSTRAMIFRINDPFFTWAVHSIMRFPTKMCLP